MKIQSIILVFIFMIGIFWSDQAKCGPLRRLGSWLFGGRQTQQYGGHGNYSYDEDEEGEGEGEEDEESDLFDEDERPRHRRGHVQGRRDYEFDKTPRPQGGQTFSQYLQLKPNGGYQALPQYPMFGTGPGGVMTTSFLPSPHVTGPAGSTHLGGMGRVTPGRSINYSSVATPAAIAFWATILRDQNIPDRQIFNDVGELISLAMRAQGDEKVKPDFYKSVASTLMSQTKEQQAAILTRLQNAQKTITTDLEKFIHDVLTKSVNYTLGKGSKDIGEPLKTALDTHLNWVRDWNTALRRVASGDKDKPTVNLDATFNYMSKETTGREWINNQVREFGSDALESWVASEKIKGTDTGKRLSAILSEWKKSEQLAPSRNPTPVISSAPPMSVSPAIGMSQQPIIAHSGQSMLPGQGIPTFQSLLRPPVMGGYPMGSPLMGSTWLSSVPPLQMGTSSPGQPHCKDGHCQHTKPRQGTQ
ncbi:MAG: hypothetical protein HY537_06990 [Deltaproteobacteria bacterium]|nr:hypothetical protein [Deltaproteobacteria bacterium]